MRRWSSSRPGVATSTVGGFVSKRRTSRALFVPPNTVCTVRWAGAWKRSSSSACGAWHFSNNPARETRFGDPRHLRRDLGRQLPRWRDGQHVDLGGPDRSACGSAGALLSPLLFGYRIAPPAIHCTVLTVRRRPRARHVRSLSFVYVTLKVRIIRPIYRCGEVGARAATPGRLAWADAGP